MNSKDNSEAKNETLIDNALLMLSFYEGIMSDKMTVEDRMKYRDFLTYDAAASSSIFLLNFIMNQYAQDMGTSYEIISQNIRARLLQIVAEK